MMMKQVTKKRLAITLAAAAVAVSLAGCSASERKHIWYPLPTTMGNGLHVVGDALTGLVPYIPVTLYFDRSFRPLPDSGYDHLCHSERTENHGSTYRNSRADHVRCPPKSVKALTVQGTKAKI